MLAPALEAVAGHPVDPAVRSSPHADLATDRRLGVAPVAAPERVVID
ncbi:hypothetical protein [Actinoplanes teichomyceticus]|uniref:Uncharacterized protein n=1 Tax=Actinoplanes teichomyceticus TaxID=1867 RepID=A0A561WIF0_ACTTI|nr:hypothetical protein [Actinoplanes teichomyceticus]TWG23636.1 hypothetical protein FHX34_102185 [Actinoplanes teichomyceticus]GIF11675.1 hypothetical protein Ate01nite_17070 [Actinoplanes teichomyceticus]